jgi:hypothetical protein
MKTCKACGDVLPYTAEFWPSIRGKAVGITCRVCDRAKRHKDRAPVYARYADFGRLWEEIKFDYHPEVAFILSIALSSDECHAAGPQSTADHMIALCRKAHGGLRGRYDGPDVQIALDGELMATYMSAPEERIVRQERRIEKEQEMLTAAGLSPKSAGAAEAINAIYG